MSISHWGLFAGWWAVDYSHSSEGRPAWKPVSFEEFCAVLDGTR